MSEVQKVDILAIGCGPFNIGLAAMASTVEDVEVLVVDSVEEFRWHPGLMFDEAKLQVSFLSDLVSLVDPTHPMSFLAYLADVDRLYPFLVREDFFPTRREYEAYLLWAVGKLTSLRFSTTVEAVRWDEAAGHFEVSVTSGGEASVIHAGHVVVGVGTEPAIPAALSTDSPALVHSSQYLFQQEAAHRADAVTVIGSGQSGAEIVIDLLEANLRGGPAVRWWTRTPWFAPLDFTKLSLEMTTPAYMDYFHSLPEETRDRVRAGHWQFHKGISSDTLERLHDLLYRRQLLEKLPPVQLRNGVAVEGLDTLGDGRLRIRGKHLDTGARLAHTADLVIAATGYRPRKTDFLAPVADRLRRDSRGRPVVEANHAVAADEALSGRIFVANAEAHAVGVSAPNLDIGAVRNAKILNSVLGREVYRLPRNTAFTSFGVTDEEIVK
ncbi:SidA/IucD/PvdA family monooxygenase [Nocardia puris]|uniref:L-lysine N6-monooxygenase MbtG n=1 Tax=Nocardia puris TaxID=208602 RepID=A0A366D814_9NOCA|nr:SidA/IucD/PvdA family monooxygenase [Nocardia puris]MBF6212364.1 SidA/IucD/PvdA family monooxygenase [Nocardia puris]MBF6366611.1 SidA/IucD/PvdA family monooxygenase [Nocardia puris]MBF6460953.1 SidA/IucD/PvdA family monooxygenase [Nocardia puris]RBO85604.1 lysine N6-hydroxylase [Nocardia puris]